MAFGYLLYGGTDAVERYMRDRWALPLYRKVVDRTGKQFVEFETDTREEVDSRLQSVSSVIYFGHGSPGGLGDPAVIDATNVGLVDGMVVAIACHSAEELGPAAVVAGTRAYVGFMRRLPIVQAPVYDALIVDNLTPLATGEASTGEFETRFQAACGVVEEKYLSRAVRNPNTHLIGSQAALMGERLRVLGDGDARC